MLKFQSTCGAVLMAALAFSLAFTLGGCDKAGSKSQAGGPVMTLAGAPVSKGDVTRVVNASGKVVPRDEIMVGSEVSGRILEVGVDFNSSVKAGDILAKIDPQNLENQLRQLASRFESAKADVQVQEAGIERAKVTLAQAETSLARKAQLLAQDAVSKAQVEENERAVGVARADLNLANARLQSSKSSVTAIEAQISDARVNLSRTIIRSPIDGVIIDRKVDPGQTVQASFSAPQLFVIAADLSEIQVEAQIVESDVGGLDAGDKARFTVDAYPDTYVFGEVEQLRLKSSTENNIVSYVAVIRAKNEAGLLMPGMTANLEITTEILSGVTRIPAVAERFRPTPDQMEQWTASDAASAAPKGLNDTVYDRLLAIGMTDEQVRPVRERLDGASKPLTDIINDPEKSFMHTPMRIRLEELSKNVVREMLTPAQNSAYNALLGAERNVREAKLWVKTADNKMRPVDAKLGLSDGAFSQVVSGLSVGDEVITAIKAESEGGARGKAGSGGKGAGGKGAGGRS